MEGIISVIEAILRWMRQGDPVPVPVPVVAPSYTRRAVVKARRWPQ
jgi:hypothetical protein